MVEVAIFVVLPELGPGSLTFNGLVTAAGQGSLSAIGTLAINGGIAGGISSAVSGGNILKGVGLGALSAGASFGIGGPLGASLGGTVASNFIAQGAIGGIVSVAEGGKFGSGFLSAGIGSLAGPLTGGGFSPKGLIVSSVLGGFASVLGGGKFANGAITGAFAYTLVANIEKPEPSRAGQLSGPSAVNELTSTQRTAMFNQDLAALGKQGLIPLRRRRRRTRVLLCCG